MKRGHSNGQVQRSMAELMALAVANEPSSQSSQGVAVEPMRPRKLELESEEFEPLHTPLKRHASAPPRTPASASVEVLLESPPAEMASSRVVERSVAVHEEEEDDDDDGEDDVEFAGMEDVSFPSLSQQSQHSSKWDVTDGEDDSDEEEEEEEEEEDVEDNRGELHETAAPSAAGARKTEVVVDDRRPEEDERDNPLFNGKHVAEKRAAVEAAAAQFDLWVNILAQDFSVLLSGVGSKYAILQRFCEEKMSKQLPCIVVKGFTVHMTGPELCMSLVNTLAHIFDCVAQTEKLKLMERWKVIATRLSERGLALSSDEEGDEELEVDANDDVHLGANYNSQEMRPGVISASPAKKVEGKWARRKRVCVVVHSIDGLQLRSPELQSLLCDIASTPEIQLIASIDDVNMPKAWSKEVLERFRWWWVPVHTFQLYLTEDTMARAATEQQPRAESLSEKVDRLLLVLRSLSEKHQVATLALCEMQLTMVEAGVKRPDVWVTMADWSRAESVENMNFQRVAQTLLKELMQGEQLEQKSKTRDAYRLKGLGREELKEVRRQLGELIAAKN
jgi:hypothetical protein